MLRTFQMPLVYSISIHLSLSLSLSLVRLCVASQHGPTDLCHSQRAPALAPVDSGTRFKKEYLFSVKYEYKHVKCGG